MTEASLRAYIGQECVVRLRQGSDVTGRVVFVTDDLLLLSLTIGPPGSFWPLAVESIDSVRALHECEPGYVRRHFQRQRKV